MRPISQADTQHIAYAKNPSNATLAREDPSKSKEARAIEAARVTISKAQGEYEQLEREKAGGINSKRAPDADVEDRASKKAKTEDDDDMEIEMEDDDDVNVSVLCSNLPAECNEAIMGALFSQ